MSDSLPINFVTISMRGDSSQLEYLQQELDRCWQDDREAKSRMLQAIAAAAAVLTIVYAFIVSAIPSEKTSMDGASSTLVGDSSQFVFGVCIVLSIATIITCISYVAAMSVISLARYSHMRELEREIIEISKVTSKDSPDLPRIGWLELRGTLATLHPNRIFNKYAAMHFMGSCIALIGVLVVCGCFILLYTQLPEYRWQVPVISVLTIVPFLGAAFYVFMQSSQHTKDILDAARDTARDSRVEFDGQQQFGDLKTVEEKREKGKANVRWFLKYALYPRLQDLPKFLFIAAGYWFGFLHHGLNATYGPVSRDTALPGLCFTLLVLEYLVYQARYQINDIRGREEDAQNPAREARHRLLNMFGDPALSVKLSALVAGYRLLVAGVLIAASWDSSGPIYLVCTVVIGILAIGYEALRAHSWSTKILPGKAVVLSVVTGLSYALRVLYGVVCGLSWSGVSLEDVFPALYAGAVLLAPLCFGSMLLGIAVSIMLRRLEAVEVIKAHEITSYPKDHVAYVAEKCAVAEGIRGAAPLLTMQSGWTAWATFACLAVGVYLSGCTFLLEYITAPDLVAEFRLVTQGVFALLVIALASSVWRSSHVSGTCNLIARLSLLVACALALIPFLQSANVLTYFDIREETRLFASMISMHLIASISAVCTIRIIARSDYESINNLPRVVCERARARARGFVAHILKL